MKTKEKVHGTRKAVAKTKKETRKGAAAGGNDGATKPLSAISFTRLRQERDTKAREASEQFSDLRKLFIEEPGDTQASEDDWLAPTDLSEFRRGLELSTAQATPTDVIRPYFTGFCLGAGVTAFSILLGKLL